MAAQPPPAAQAQAPQIRVTGFAPEAGGRPSAAAKREKKGKETPGACRQDGGESRWRRRRVMPLYESAGTREIVIVCFHIVLLHVCRFLTVHSFAQLHVRHSPACFRPSKTLSTPPANNLTPTFSSLTDCFEGDPFLFGRGASPRAYWSGLAAPCLGAPYCERRQCWQRILFCFVFLFLRRVLGQH